MSSIDSRSDAGWFSGAIGEALDLALLGLAAPTRKGVWKLAAAIAAVGGAGALDIIAGIRTQNGRVPIAR